jgi:hypothetical protein
MPFDSSSAAVPFRSKKSIDTQLKNLLFDISEYGTIFNYVPHCGIKITAEND